MPDELGVDGDPAALPLAVDLVQPHHRNTAACDHLAQHRAGADGGKLVDVADQDDLTARLDCVKQGVGNKNVQHGDLVHQKKVGVQRRRRAEAAIIAGVEPDRPVDCGGRMSGGLLHPSGCPPGRRTADDPPFGMVLLIDLQDRPLDHCFAGAGAAGDHAQRRGQGGLDGRLLLRGEAQLEPRFLRGDLFTYIYDGRNLVFDTLRKDFFGKMLLQPRGLLPIDVAEIGAQTAVGQHPHGAVGQHVARQLRRLQQTQTELDEPVLLQAQMRKTLLRETL